jgi:hypothetical protein
MQLCSVVHSLPTFPAFSQYMYIHQTVRNTDHFFCTRQTVKFAPLKRVGFSPPVVDTKFWLFSLFRGNRNPCIWTLTESFYMFFFASRSFKLYFLSFASCFYNHCVGFHAAAHFNLCVYSRRNIRGLRARNSVFAVFYCNGVRNWFYGFKMTIVLAVCTSVSCFKCNVESSDWHLQKGVTQRAGVRS